MIIANKWLDEKYHFLLVALGHCHPMVIALSLNFPLCGFFILPFVYVNLPIPKGDDLV